MKTSILALAPLAAGLTLAFGASAQDHSQHQTPMPATEHEHHPAPKPAAKPKPKARKAPAKKPAPVINHAAMGHGVPPSVPAAPEDHAATGHSMPMPADEMDHAAMGHAMPRSPDQPLTPIPPVTDADRASAQPPPQDHPVHDNGIFHFVQFNRLEGFDADEGRGLEWEGQAWIGTDLNKLWLRSEGERIGGHTEAADLEVLYGRSFARWWDVVAGVRHDFQPGSSQDFAAFGVMGLAPYKFEVEATAYIGTSGQTAARLEAEYETLLTNRLILQPLVEVNFYGKNDASRGIGSGLSTAEAGLRLRYEFTRKFAPYVGVVYERAFGNTADLRRNEQERTDDTRVVVGIRTWF